MDGSEARSLVRVLLEALLDHQPNDCRDLLGNDRPDTLVQDGANALKVVEVGLPGKPLPVILHVRRAPGPELPQHDSKAVNVGPLVKPSARRVQNLGREPLPRCQLGVGGVEYALGKPKVCHFGHHRILAAHGRNKNVCGPQIPVQNGWIHTMQVLHASSNVYGNLEAEVGRQLGVGKWAALQIIHYSEGYPAPLVGEGFDEDLVVTPFLRDPRADAIRSVQNPHPQRLSILYRDFPGELRLEIVRRVHMVKWVQNFAQCAERHVLHHHRHFWVEPHAMEPHNVRVIENRHDGCLPSELAELGLGAAEAVLQLLQCDDYAPVQRAVVHKAEPAAPDLLANRNAGLLDVVDVGKGHVGRREPNLDRHTVAIDKGGLRDDGLHTRFQAEERAGPPVNRVNDILRREEGPTAGRVQRPKGRVHLKRVCIAVPARHQNLRPLCRGKVVLQNAVHLGFELLDHR
mmetsp:Transcript_34771/g.98099  ORF Transcript_34771/g.98099 Transcript_34771/m.98099 type:complete len:459 (+) Transcript_34771:930-2306(+)